ncbi:MAG: fasciclin domain-containing protein [Actinobacteria bacterium]|nr:fasciclin domain-containing protein [Actinomycetota bacterium]
MIVLTAAGCGSGSSSASPTPSPSITPKVVPSVSTGTILEAAKAGDLNAFLGAVALAGLQRTLEQKIPFTVFAPNDEAFKSIGLEELMKNVPKLKSIMAFHIVPTQNLKAADITNGEKVMSYEGSPLTFTVNGAAVKVNDANVVQVIEGPTWSIFVIDKVLVPASAEALSASPSP